MRQMANMIWKTDSGLPGPRLIVLGGIHGNELTGIEVVRALVDGFSTGGLALAAGSITLALGNPKAIALGRRATAPELDLNRSFTEAKIAHPSAYEEERAAELAPFIADADVLIDVHATNKPSKPFVVATEFDGRRGDLAKRFPCDAFVVAPDAVIGGTTDGWITRHGGFGIGYESGIAGDLTKVRRTKEAVLRIARDLRLLAGSVRGDVYAQDVIDIEKAVVLDGRTFEFSPGKGLASFEPFAENETLGHLDGRPVTAPFDGLLLFPKPDHLRRPGLPVGFLARRTRTSSGTVTTPSSRGRPSR